MDIKQLSFLHDESLIGLSEQLDVSDGLSKTGEKSLLNVCCLVVSLHVSFTPCNFLHPYACRVQLEIR